MYRHLIATRTVFLDFHLFRMLSLITGAQVVFFATFSAFEYYVFSHDLSLQFSMPDYNNTDGDEKTILFYLNYVTENHFM